MLSDEGVKASAGVELIVQSKVGESRFLVLDALGLPGECGAGGRCRRRVAVASEMAASDGSGEGGWRQRCDGHELSRPIDGRGHSRGWQPDSKVWMMTIRPPQQGQVFHSSSA